jgi:hypothetical protein
VETGSAYTGASAKISLFRQLLSFDHLWFCNFIPTANLVVIPNVCRRFVRQTVGVAFTGC